MNKIEEGLSHRITRFLHYTYHERSDENFLGDFLDGGEGGSCGDVGWRCWEYFVKVWGRFFFRWEDGGKCLAT